jgi:hypothetical protein
MRWIIILVTLLAIYTWIVQPTTGKPTAPYQGNIEESEYAGEPSRDTWKYWAYKNVNKIFYCEK